jgi:cytochrome P450
VLEFLSADVRRNPFPLYEQLRRVSPIVHDARSGVWMIFDHDGVKRVLNDNEAFSSNVMRGTTAKWLVFQDAPRHTKLRALVMSAFTPKTVSSLEPRIRRLSGELLDWVIEQGEMDIVSDYAVPLPMMVIAEMLGIPTQDWPSFREWSDVILNLSHTLPGGDRALKAAEEFRGVTAEMSEYLSTLIEQRRRQPTGDLLTRLVHAEVDGERLQPDEILGFFQLLLVAGHETTTNLIANSMLSFLDYPDQLERLRARPELLESAIEEVLRFRSPVQWMMRMPRRSVELHGETIHVGTMVLPMIGSANRDENVFRDADRFDISRDPNPHIAFGHGIHFCIGAALSRLEARIALPDLLSRLGDFEFAGVSAWEPRDALHVHGPASLPIRFSAPVGQTSVCGGI